ncbi:MAG: pyridoxamine 5'-phosphate oxidase family protein [bacterium]|nr:pyridoxamine 5'-phosphate oxidase family protein [bacterium]
MTEQHYSSPADRANVTSEPEEVEKVNDLLDGFDVAMVTTVDSDSAEGRLTSRPLSTQEAREDGVVLFLVRGSSAIAKDIEANPNVNVAYSSMKAWVSLSGTAEIVEDPALVAELWSAGAEMFMDGGPEDPDNRVMRVTGETAAYWGGESLVATVVKTIKTITGRGQEKDEEGGTTVVEL